MAEPPAGARRRRPLAAGGLLIVAALGGPPGRPATGTVCLHDGIEPSATARLIEEAVAVLSRSGHDPTAYRVELRMEDATSPDAPTLRARRVPSVVFEPAGGGEHYPLRVHPSRPCVAAWVWQPDRLTSWQRRVVAQARAGLEALGPAGARRADDLRVMETRDLVRVEVLRDGRAAAVTLAKPDLALVDAARWEEGAAE